VVVYLSDHYIFI